MSRWWPRSAVASVLLLCGSVAIAGASGNVSAIDAAIEATDVTVAARSLTEQVIVIAGGGLLLGAGVGVVAAASVAYWYKNRQIARRLR